MSSRELWRAAHESRHWSFEAFGETAEEATETLTRTLRAHQLRTGATMEWLAEATADAADPRRLLFGVGYRDGEICDPGRVSAAGTTD